MRIAAQRRFGMPLGVLTALSLASIAVPEADASAKRVLEAPTALKVVKVGRQHVELDWRGAAGARDYRIYRNGRALRATPRASAYVDRGLKPGRVHTYEVAARAGGRTSARTARVTARVGRALARSAATPAVPTGLRVVSTSSSRVVLDWEDNAGSFGRYQVYRNDRLIANGPTASTYTDSSVANGASYTYRVSAGTSAGYSAWTAPVNARAVATTAPAPAPTPTPTPAPVPTSGSATPTSKPAVPSGLKVAATADGQVKLDWNDNGDAFGRYQVYRDDKLIADGPTASEYTDSGLVNGRRYGYRVSAGVTGLYSAWSATPVYATPTGSTSAPAPAPSEPTPAPTPTSSGTVKRIAVAGDIACDPSSSAFNGGNGTATACRQRATSDLVVGRGYDRAVLTGDIQYEDGRAEAFNKSYGPSWGRFKSITEPTPGNHDYYTSGALGYYGYFGPLAGAQGKGFRAVEIGSWRFYMMNSQIAMGGGSEQEKWLRADLAANPRRCTAIVMHYPRFSSGQHGSKTTTVALLNAFDAAGGDVSLAGHDHFYERFAKQTASGAKSSSGFRHFVVGNGGKSFYGLSSVKANSESRITGAFGILDMTLRDGAYDWKMIDIAGKVRDSGTDTCD